MAATTTAHNFLGYKTACAKTKNQSRDSIKCHNRVVSRTAGIQRDSDELLHKTPCRSASSATRLHHPTIVTFMF